MSMSQLKTPDEEWDEIWQNVRWYHLPLIVLAIVGGCILCAVLSLTRRK